MSSTSNQIKLFPVTPTHHNINILSQGVALPSKNKQTIVLELGKDCIDRCLEILEWRLKTFLPVIKPVHFEVNPQRALSPLKHQHIANRSPHHFQKTSVSIQSFRDQMNNQSDMKRPDAMCEVLVQIQEIRFLLSNIKLLSFPQAVYLLKEMMIGYEVLVDIFGIFEPSDQMIAVNGANQWKLWVNSNFTMNAIPAQNMSEKEFIYKLIVIAEKHCLETTLSKRFFMDLKEITYSQECSFVRVLQTIKQLAVNNKVYAVNIVILPKEQSIQDKTLKKQKGYNRIEQLKSSLIDGRFIPKQIWNYKTQKNDPSVCSIGDLDVSPARKVESMRDQDDSYTNDNQLSTAWKTHSQLHDYFTPREKTNSNAVQLYSPQIPGETQRSPVRQNKQTVSPRLSFTISNSLIERRRRSDQVKCTAKFQTVNQILTVRNNSKEMDENQYQFKRQMATKYLNQVGCRQSKQIDMMNSCNESPSTQLKESQGEKCSTAYKNLKKNDFQACGKTRNNHSGFVNISIPIYHHSNNKNLSISYQFKTQNEQKEKEHQEGSDPPISQQWKNTISGLFSDTATVRELKTSIKIKTPKDKKQARKYSTDVNLEILSKMGRQANDSFDEDEEQDKQYLQIEQLKLREESLILQNGTILKDEQQDEILRKPSSSTYIMPKIVISGPPKQKRNVCI